MGRAKAIQSMRCMRSRARLHSDEPSAARVPQPPTGYHKIRVSGSRHRHSNRKRHGLLNRGEGPHLFCVTRRRKNIMISRNSATPGCRARGKFALMRKLAHLLFVLLLTTCALRGAEPARPQVPDKTFAISDYGAVGDGKTLATDAITKAIAACRDAGGGVVVVPAGKYLTAPFDLVSKVELRIEEGATLLLTDDPAAYPIEDNRHRM